jgi:hypothetical protein
VFVLGTDAEGAVVKVEGGKATKLTAIPGAIATIALAQAGGALYAGGLPSDTIWKLDGGKATAFAKLPEVETVWALAAGADGTLYAGTGPAGKVFAIDRAGKARLLFDTEDKRVTAVTVTSDGAVWFGTSERALVFRYDPKTKTTRAMADFAGNEIAAIAEAGGAVVVAANDLAEPPIGPTKSATVVAAAEKPGSPKGQAAKLPEVGSKPGADKDTPGNADTQRKGARKGKGALFRVGADGQLEQLHALTQTYFTSIAVGPDGAIYAGAADKGRVYLVEPDDTVATAFDVDERAVAQVFWDGKQAWRSPPTTPPRCTAPATRPRARSTCPRCSTPRARRSGAASSGRAPASSASRPAAATPPSRASAGARGPRPASRPPPAAAPPAAASPARPAATCSSGSACPTTARCAGSRATTCRRTPAPRSTRSRSSWPTRRASPTLKEAGGKPRNPTLKVRWKVDNQDGDDTAYVLAVRRDGDADWRALSLGKPPFTSTSFEWNTETFADGWYRLRVSSSDAIANSPDRALEAARTSALFVVDNTPPTIAGLAVKAGKAEAEIADALSVVTELAFSIDDEPWRLATTVDGIFDDQAERLRLAVPTLAKGTHTLSIRAADAAGNVAAATATFVVR